jgi:ABC-type transport system involved in Fe-S cluster assembly fused permease/ATPase subunit
VIYREIKQATTDMDRMFVLLGTQQEVADTPGAPVLDVNGAEVRFRHVGFGYEKNRVIRRRRFHDRGGHDNAVVGHSGSGKSTLARLLFRFYDVTRGSIEVDGQDIRRCGRSACARRSASCRRTPCCSTTASTTTSPMAARRPRARSHRGRARRADRHLYQRIAAGLRHAVGERAEAVRRREASALPSRARC